MAYLARSSGPQEGETGHKLGVDSAELIITMQLQRSDRQNLMSKFNDSDDESLQCKETLAENFLFNNENRVKHCGCRCRCNLQDLPEDPIEKKRQKRKQYKRRLKERQKEEKEKALMGLEKIIRDIYSLRINFRRAQAEIEQCLSVDNNRQRLCSFINMVIRDEVELIRKQIALVLNRYEILHQGQQDQAVKSIFAPIERIAAASAEIEKLINVFIASYSDQKDTPLQKNFGRTTLKFLVKADLYKSGVFSKVCSYIFQSPPGSYPRQRDLVSFMMASFDSYEDDGELSQECSETEEDSEEYLEFENDSWEKEGSTIESLKNDLQQKLEEEIEAKPEGNKRTRKERRRKLKEETERDYDAILKRVVQMQVNENNRVACNVREEWVAHISQRKWKYTKKHGLST